MDGYVVEIRDSQYSPVRAFSAKSYATLASAMRRFGKLVEDYWTE